MITYVLTRTQCDKCFGAGEVEHWARKAAYEKGLYGDATEKWLIEQLKEIPPDRVECEQCGGKGYLEQWENLQAIIRVEILKLRREEK